MRKTLQAEHTPGECFTCGRAEGPFVDTLREEHRGRVYICKLCISGMARIVDVGQDDREAVDTLDRQLRASQAALAAERNSHEELRQAVLLTLKQGAVTRHGQIQLRRRPS